MIQVLPAAPRHSPGRCWALSMLPGSGPQPGSGLSGHPARRQPSGRLPGGSKPLVSLCGGFLARPGAQRGGEHAYWREKAVLPSPRDPQPRQRETRPTGDEPGVPVALACFRSASGLHHFLSIARAKCGSPVGNLCLLFQGEEKVAGR